MSDQVRAVVFVLLALVILFAWQHFYKPAVPPPQPNATTPAQTIPHSTTAPPVAAATTKTPGIGRVSAVPVIPVILENEEKTVVVESPLYRVELSNRGGVVKSWKLKKYFDDQKPPHDLDLVNPDVAGELGWPFSLMLFDAQQETLANSSLYQITPESNHFTAPATITFHWSDGHLDVTKKMTFNESYETSIETSVTFDGKQVQGSAIAWRGGFGDKAVYRAALLVNVFYKLNGKLELLPLKKLGASGNQIQPVMQAGPLEFTGMEDQFFTASFMPDSTGLSLWHWTQFHHITTGEKPEAEQVAEMAAGSPMPEPLQMRVYVGPKDLTLLSREKPPLDELVQFGWTGIIAKPLFEVLKWIHKYIPNYGWAIVVLTLVINGVMFPLKMKSWRSMQKMQKAAPEIKQIQDRYKKYSMSDPRKKKMNEEVMAIYSREGINPMGSCLPMLFQMPIWWALWRVLNGAIELRHAPWSGTWIHDLSAMDPYYILPIVMTITMYLMTKMTPQTSADPAQQKMMALMPLFMGFIFFKLSSGLNLYMFTSNLVGMGQQYYLNRTEPLPSRSKFKKKPETA
ncbi:MAG: membrane protein insertase YidC [Candidatus Acidiferrales bacterium]